MPNPVCPTGCNEATPVPNFSFDFCAPEFHAGEISEIWITKRGQPLVGANEAALLTHITTRLAASDETRIEVLTVLGDKPDPTQTEITISKGRRIIASREHTINFSIDEVNLLNYNAMRTIQCGAGFLAWYTTSDGQYLYGGNEGIPVSMTMNEVIPRGRGELMTINGVLSWSSKFSPAVVENPLA